MLSGEGFDGGEILWVGSMRRRVFFLAQILALAWWARGHRRRGGKGLQRGAGTYAYGDFKTLRGRHWTDDMGVGEWNSLTAWHRNMVRLRGHGQFSFATIATYPGRLA